MTLPAPLFVFSAFWTLLEFFLGTASPAPAPVAPTPAPAVVSARNSAPDSRTLEFVENEGQWPKQVSYAADIAGGKMFLQPTGFVYVLRDPTAVSQHGHSPEADAATQRTTSASKRIRSHAYSVTFENANAAPALQGQEITPGTRNYYLGKDPKKWGKGARGFRQVQYKSLYKGVDMALYEQGGQLKYDLHVAPGASPAQIKLNYTGANLSLENGNLRVETSVGHLTEHKPVAYQLVQNQRVEVKCQYQLNGQRLSFQFPDGYDQQLPLVIDPVVEFSSFTGSTADNWGYTATYDSQGNMYSGGIVSSIGYPVTTGAFDENFNGNWDIAIIKYDTKAIGPAARLYATYIGGASTETPHSLVVNAADELIVLGTTSSADYPTSVNAVSRNFKGGESISPLGSGGNPVYDFGSDLVITRLSSNGDALLASTFLGGTHNDGLLSKLPTPTTPSLVQNYGDQYRGDIITDPNGNIYIASNTSSADFPARNGFRSQQHGGTHDAVVCKLSPDLSQVLWASYYGGAGIDAAYSIQLDQNRQVYVCGGTTSASLPGTANGMKPISGGNTDGFVLKINNTGTAIMGATFMGTPAYDQTYFLQLDAANSVYLFGQTLGDYPVTRGTYRNNNGRQFLHKLSNDLSTTVWSTAFGSGRNTIDISPTAFLVDDCQRIYISGWGGTNNAGVYGNGTVNGLPTTPGAAQTVTDGGDFYLMQLGTDASQLLYATFFGGYQGISGGSYEHVDGGTSRFDKKGYVYQAVCGGCQGRSNFPFPPGANYYSRINNSLNCNNAAFKFDFAEELRADAGPDQEICVEGPALRMEGSPSGGVWSGDGVTMIGGRYYFTPAPALIGDRTLTYTVTGTGACSIANTMILKVLPPEPHTLTMPDTIFCVNSTAVVPLTASPAGGVFSGKGVSGATFTPATAGVGKHVITYINDGLNGSCGAVTQTVEVISSTLNLGPDTTLCPGSMVPFQLRANIAGGTWSGPNISSSGMFTPPAGFSGSVNVTYSITQPCPATGTRKITVLPPPSMEAHLANACADNPDISGYAPFNATFANGTTNASSFTWQFGDGTQSNETAPRHLYQTPGNYQVTLVATYGNGCQEILEVGEVVVKPPFIPNIFTPNGDGKNDTFVQHFSCLPTEIIVYNLWGKQIFQQKIYNQKWDGGDLSEGTYFYILKDTDGNTAKGWVEILK
ncbi:gliding motility-associated C-terminal domain-containing protein [Rufibacter sediminis]|uniref:Gliding motility-associated C-terminal domain-containing protein n=1 Tax=Rufibacter sediminis TaxID=2762756 RepID=A0ABR6VPD0_9BACT|nr:gliding motility-associated C-terminal domain-containing protein [Rufibacter sediminis]MBC3539045.1 gliding motility-associated C-terminal domain-containing protein [Rufibacter sediminis]